MSPASAWHDDVTITECAEGVRISTAVLVDGCWRAVAWAVRLDGVGEVVVAGLLRRPASVDAAIERVAARLVG